MAEVTAAQLVAEAYGRAESSDEARGARINLHTLGRLYFPDGSHIAVEVCGWEGYGGERPSKVTVREVRRNAIDPMKRQSWGLFHDGQYWHYGGDPSVWCHFEGAFR